jgi:ABC-type nitrate/sulfonate/bicarbonate transport system substrate-binding protein
VLGASDDFVMKYTLENAAIDPDYVAFIGVGSGESVIAPIEQKNIDLLLNYDSVITLPERRGAARSRSFWTYVRGRDAGFVRRRLSILVLGSGRS